MEKHIKKLKADLHLHTCDGIKDEYISYDAFKLIDVAMQMGYEVLSITNHDTVTYNDYLKDYAYERGILLIPGIELTLNRKHILVYNVLDPVNTIKDIRGIERIKDRNNLFIAPHPFFPAGHSLGKMFVTWQHLFDAVELCHFYTDFINFNKKALDMAAKFNLPIVGTSDSHLLCQLDTTYSHIHADAKDTDAVIEAVKKGAVEVVTSPLSLMQMGMIYNKVCLNYTAKKFGTACFYYLSFLLRN